MEGKIVKFKLQHRNFPIERIFQNLLFFNLIKEVQTPAEKLR